MHTFCVGPRSVNYSLNPASSVPLLHISKAKQLGGVLIRTLFKLISRFFIRETNSYAGGLARYILAGVLNELVFKKCFHR